MGICTQFGSDICAPPPPPLQTKKQNKKIGQWMGGMLQWDFARFALRVADQYINCRDRSVYAPRQWFKMLRCKVISHWMGTHTMIPVIETPPGSCLVHLSANGIKSFMSFTKLSNTCRPNGSILFICWSVQSLAVCRKILYGYVIFNVVSSNNCIWA